MKKMLKIKNLELRKFLIILADQMTHIEVFHENPAGFGTPN